MFKIALYDNTPTLRADSTVYAATGEIPNGAGYTTGGQALATNVLPAVASNVAADTAFWSWSANPSWTSATFTAYGALIYNTNGANNRSVAVLDFGGSKPVSSGTFTIVLPTNDKNNAILRIA